ncbi:hypothetical protein JG688_00000925 [Phytophthora aleatoria]|uniref:Homeobox domain-containing protein n=1 Tax=Phytophthora aleatoria TaxID=2496075 RepID=A0A8J5IWG7_9STRA|nr:hypothetical protein JG688_00000925 [Phytophthora aleatoria]
MGTLRGRFDDVLEGLYCDNTEDMLLMNAIKCPRLAESAVLYAVQKKTTLDSYAFTGIKWTTIKLPVGSHRDLCYFDKMGMVRQKSGKRMAYHFEDDLVGIYMKGEMNYTALPCSATTAVSDVLLAVTNTLDVAELGAMQDGKVCKIEEETEDVRVDIQDSDRSLTSFVRKISAQMHELTTCGDIRASSLSTMGKASEDDLDDDVLNSSRLKSGQFVALDKSAMEISRRSRSSTTSTSSSSYAQEGEDPEQFKATLFAKLQQVTNQAEETLSFARKQSFVAQSGLTPLLCMGTLRGRFDDVLEGLYCDNTEDMLLMNAIKCPRLAESAVLYAVQKKTTLDSYAFTGIKWTTIKLPVGSHRDLCYFDKMGMVRQKSGKRMAYHVMQSVDLLEYAQKSTHKREKVSLCYLFEELEDDLVGVYMQGEINYTALSYFARIAVSDVLLAQISKMLFMNAITCPRLTESAVLSVVQKRARLEPYAFTGIKWSTIKLTMANNRDLCYFDKMGMVRQATGKRMAYHVMQSVELPEYRNKTTHQRAHVSLCYVFEELEDDLVGVYMKGDVDIGTTSFFVAKAVSEVLLAFANALELMLATLSPTYQGSAAPQSMPTKQDSLAPVEQSRQRLLEDQAFQANESYQRMLMLANNPEVKIQPGAIDPLALVIERLPTNSMSYQGFGAGNNFSAGDTSRSQYMQAVARQNIADAAEQVEDPTIKARYDQTAHRLHEWGERRMVQHQQQQEPVNTGRGPNTLPSLSLSLSQVSPYAMELAARNNMPKKRSSLSKLSKKLMHDWFEHNLHHPYPTEEEKEWLAQEGGITLEQVNNWFINTRGRKWKPMINRLMAEKKAGNCSLFDKMAKKIEEPYRKL